MITLIDAKQFLADFHSKQGVMDKEELVKEMGLAPPAIKGKKKATKKEKKLEESLKRARDSVANHPISSLLAEQGNTSIQAIINHNNPPSIYILVEFANLLVLNKIDTVSEKELLELEDIVHALNPDALIKKTEFGRLPLDEILNVRLFDFQKASTSAGNMHQYICNSHLTLVFFFFPCCCCCCCWWCRMAKSAQWRVRDQG
jgi:G3E family GTPase